jgi:hypothetical protein
MWINNANIIYTLNQMYALGMESPILPGDETIQFPCQMRHNPQA